MRQQKRFSNCRTCQGMLCLVCIVAMRLTLALCAETKPNENTRVSARCIATFLDSAAVEQHVEARLLLEAQDGGLLLESRDGRLWNVLPQQLRKLERLTEPFQPLKPNELGIQLQQEVVELGIKAESQIVVTKHFVLCSTAGKKYAEWVGGLLERLHDGFHAFWKTNLLELQEPEFPLPVIVLRDQAEFAKFATKHDGRDAAQSQGYFSIATNRVVMFDLTAGPSTSPAKTFEDIRRKILASPFNVATVIHEATHQIAFNSGLHTRYADNPMWLTEGMAMFFEVPDLESRVGWKSVGQLNKLRLRDFRETAKVVRDESRLATLLQVDDRFQSAEQARAAYSESWALTYFLIKTRREDYVRYLKMIQSKPRLVADTPMGRLREFQSVFGDDLVKLELDFRKWIARRNP